MYNTTENTITISKTIKVTDDDLIDIMASAMTGIAYWARDCEKIDKSDRGEYYESAITKHGFYITEDETDERLVLDKETILKGLDLYINGDYEYSNDLLDGESLDCSMIDDCVSDCIVQLGIFGELIYG